MDNENGTAGPPTEKEGAPTYSGVSLGMQKDMTIKLAMRKKNDDSSWTASLLFYRVLKQQVSVLITKATKLDRPQMREGFLHAQGTSSECRKN